MFKVADLCGGVGISGMGWLGAGCDLTGFDINPACAKYYPGKFECADIKKLTASDLKDYDVVALAAPCFPAGTPVITARGVMFIEDVAVGDLMLTHQGRWRPVTETMSRLAEVGCSRWLASTPEHPFLASARLGSKQLGTPGWVPASELGSSYLAIPRSADELEIPSAGVSQDASFWYMVGRWLGDGWVRIEEPSGEPRRPHGCLSAVPGQCRHCGTPTGRNKRWPHLWNAVCSQQCSERASRQARGKPQYRVLICCAAEEADGLESKLADTGLRWSRSQERTVVRFVVCCKSLTLWLTAHFGRYAYGKTLPGWLFGAPESVREAVLDGYLDSDGSRLRCGYTRLLRQGWSVPTVSSRLAVGVRVLATTLGLGASLRAADPQRQAFIEGRPVSERRTWVLSITPERYGVPDGVHRWVQHRAPYLIRGVERVYDLTVEEDHSFVAWGYVVHNCQPWSDMCKCRPGLAETYEDLITPMRPVLDELEREHGVLTVIENVVPCSVLRPERTITLCGLMFGKQLYRHRKIETGGFTVPPLIHPPHLLRASRAGHWEEGTVMSIAGHVAPIALARELMGVPGSKIPREFLVEAAPAMYMGYVAAHAQAALSALRAA